MLNYLQLKNLFQREASEIHGMRLQEYIMHAQALYREYVPACL